MAIVGANTRRPPDWTPISELPLASTASNVLTRHVGAVLGLLVLAWILGLAIIDR